MASTDISIMVKLLSIPMSAGFTYLCCFVCTFTTESFLRYASYSYESLWYKWPINLQRILLLIILDAQRPQAFDGFEIINLDSPAFAFHENIIAVHCCISGNTSCYQLQFNVQKFGEIKMRACVRLALIDPNIRRYAN